MIRSLARRLLSASAGTPPRHALDAVVGPDGCPLASPEQAAQSLIEHFAASGGTLGDDDAPHMVRAAHALAFISGHLGWLPGTPLPLKPLADRPLHRLQLLMEDNNLPSAPTPSASKDWSAWNWGQTGCAVAHATLKDLPSRVWVSPQTIQWDWGEEVLLLSERARTIPVHTARVDGARFCAIQSDDGMTVRLEARKSRLTFKEQCDQSRGIRWILNADWQAERTDVGVLAKRDGHELVIKLDTRWSWELAGTEIRGTGTGTQQSTFELR